MKIKACVLGLLLAIVPLQSFSHMTGDLMLTRVALSAMIDLSNQKGDCMMVMANWLNDSIQQHSEVTRMADDELAYRVPLSRWQEGADSIIACGLEVARLANNADIALSALD